MPGYRYKGRTAVTGAASEIGDDVFAMARCIDGDSGESVRRGFVTVWIGDVGSPLLETFRPTYGRHVGNIRRPASLKVCEQRQAFSVPRDTRPMPNSSGIAPATPRSDAR